MKAKKIILLALIAFKLASFAQTVQFPATINLQNSTEFNNAITKVALPFNIQWFVINSNNSLIINKISIKTFG